ncbi:MAG: DUF1854 domain-containing protein [Planctomycetaceae bacterium]|nr:DUF1854 domain-containing protein [Planctomycetaceae bacterium]
MPAAAVGLDLDTDSFGRLVLTWPDGQSHVGVVPVRAFPFSAPNEWISFCDEQGHEVYFLDRLSDLSPATRARLEAELAKREFTPMIRQIESVSSGAEPTTWHVVTDRGETRFELTSEDNIRRLVPVGALVIDAWGIRYRIPDLAALDPASRKILRRYL